MIAHGNVLYYWSFYIVPVLVTALQLTVCQGQNQPQPTIDKTQEDYAKGLTFQRQAKFDSAIIFYLRFRAGQSKQPSGIKSGEVEKRIIECESGKKLMSEPRKFVVTNLGAAINSPFEDYAPVLTEDEKLIVFTSRRPAGNLSDKTSADGKYFEDVFFSYWQDGNWSAAKNMDRPVNTPFHDSDLALSADGKQLFLYTDENEGDILVSDLINGKWSQPQLLPSPINTRYHESSVSISSDGKKIFVASERPGGLGGSDIYVTEKNKFGQWGPATNLGPSVNSAWDDDSPFIDYDGNILYFSSTGHNSMGGYDIFRSLRKPGKWSIAENLGFPINTPGPDSYFVSTKDGKRGYYSSVREEGFGEEDIYLITLPPELSKEEETMSGNSGQVLVVYFPFGSAQWPAADRPRLDSVLIEIGKTPNSIIQIDGHTDDIGVEEFNQALSLSRAQAVKSYFEAKGIKPERIKVKGWGSNKPLVSDAHEKDGRALNRRAEIHVIQN